MKKTNLLISGLGLLFLLQTSSPLSAAGDLKVKAKEVMNDTKREAAKAARTIKEKSCELINGKMECVAKKVGNRLKDGAAVIEDALD